MRYEKKRMSQYQIIYETMSEKKKKKKNEIFSI